jgi:membrane-associated phospholipid phosphatase
MASGAYASALDSARQRAGTRRPGAGGALWLAGVCLVALALLWAVAELVPAAQVRDAVALRDFTLLNGPHVNAAAKFLLHLLDPSLFTIWAVAIVLIALSGGRPRVALAVACVLAAAPIVSDQLKPVLAHVHSRAGTVQIGAASWPSGHSTAALALALCAVWVARPRHRPLVAILGALFALAQGFALLVRAWHMPSDVLGGYLMAALFTALALAAVRAADRRWPQEHSAAGARR